MKKPFSVTLAAGMSFEDNVVRPLLIDTFSEYWIESTHSHKTYGYCGPVMENKSLGIIVLPDFRLINPVTKHTILVEAKFKNKTFYIPGQKTKTFVAIETSKYNDYVTSAKILDADLLFIFGIEQTKTVHLLSLPTMDYLFDNTYHYGKVKVFEINEDSVIGTLSEQ